MSLTGRVELLEQQVAFLMQEMLKNITTETLSYYSKTWNQQFDKLDDKVGQTEHDLNLLQVLYANLVIGTGAVSGSVVSGDYIEQSFETVSKNLNQYPYSLNYYSGTLTSVVYSISTGLNISKNLEYNNSGLLIKVSLSGNVPSVSLNKNLLYSGSNLTGVYYN
jgi:hypothetical protein